MIGRGVALKGEVVNCEQIASLRLQVDIFEFHKREEETSRYSLQIIMRQIERSKLCTVEPRSWMDIFDMIESEIKSKKLLEIGEC